MAVLAYDSKSAGRVRVLARSLETVDLRNLSACDIEPLLQDETMEWQHELDWDFSKSADLVRQLVEAHELSGFALMDSGEVAGLGYCGLADGKGQIWDVYVRPGWRGGNAEDLLFRLLLDALEKTAGVRRIESQLMLMSPQPALALQREPGVKSFERLLMKLDPGALLAAGKPAALAKFRLEPWSDQHHGAAASVLSLSHAGHIDAQMSEQYRTYAGASRFLYDLVQFPGCAAFCRPASHVAFDRITGQAVGIVLASFVAEGVAHIAELCVMPEARGAGLGYELLRQSVAKLKAAGAKRVSLTVTATNEDALRLYDRAGFREVRRFSAFVWEKP